MPIAAIDNEMIALGEAKPAKPIDMAFSDHAFDLGRMKDFVAGWYYYDAAVILMDHVASVHQDLRNGIANLSLIAMRDKELRDLTTLKNYNPHLTIERS